MTPRTPASRLQRYWPTAPLRTYLVAVIMLAILPLAALMIYQIFADVRGEQAQIEDELSRSATGLSQAVESELNSSVDALTALSHSEALRRRRSQPLESLLQGRPQPRRDWHSVFLLDKEGKPLLDTAAGKGLSISADGALQELGRRVISKSQPAVSGAARTPESAGPRVMLAVPVIIDGEVRYVLGARVNNNVWQRLATSAAPPGGYAVLVDGQGGLVSSTLGPETPQGTPLAPGMAEWARSSLFGVRRTTAPDGRAVYAASQSAAVADWSVQVGIPAAPIDAAHRRALLRALSASVASLLLGVVLASLAARRITLPLQQLARRGHAGLAGRVPVTEIAVLRNALREAAAQDDSARGRLLAKAQEFEALFDSSPVSMAFAQDPHCRQVMHNAAMDALLGPSVNLQNGTVVIRRGGAQLELTQMPLQRAATQGETVFQEELELCLPGHAPRFVIANAVPLRDAAGQLRGAISAWVDITQRKHAEARLLDADGRLRENQRLMELAQEAGYVGFFHYRFAEDRLAWTPGQCKLFGIDELPAGGLDRWFERIDETDRGRVEREFWTACALRRQIETLDYAATRPDGSQRWLSSRVLLHYQPDGAAAQVYGVTVDMTDHREAEMQRVQLTEREVAAREQAEAASRAKDEFLTMLSHELRNPLGAISAAVDVLDLAQPGTDSAAEARSIIGRQTRNLAHMMNDLLDVGRVLAGKILITRQPVNLAAVLDRVRRTLDITGEAAAHVLHVQQQEVWIEGDAVRLEQVITNLITNAIRYTAAGRGIQVQLMQQGSSAVFEVRDSGTGIPEALLPHIFDLFVQGDRSLDRGAGGLGIGLTLVRRLVELHGGTIAAESSDAGSCFRVTLPATPAPSGVDDNGAVPPSRRREVLVIDDNADVLAALRAKLELDGHTVSTAADGIDGLRRLLNLRPQVSIVDIGLPGLTGYELARHARAAGYAGRMIALSGYGHERDVNNALVAGFDAYLVKPVDRQQLRDSLSAD